MLPIQDVAIGDTLVRISGEGPPLVFIHGFTTTSEFWKEQVEEFSESFRVIRINLPGHGASPSPPSRSYRIDDFVEDVERVFRDQHIERAVLVGFSMGGIVAQQVVLEYPRLVETLVLVDTTAHEVGDNATAGSFLSAIDDFGIEKASQDLSDLSFGPSAPPALIEWARREVVQTPELVARMAIQSISDADTRSSLARIKARTLVIVGEDDRITPPRESELLAEGIENSTLSVIPKAGHFSMLEQPAAFNRILSNFITSGGGATRA